MNAIISQCGTYRYVLTRKTNSPLRWVKKCLFIMLNPSTADSLQDDPTIRRCIGFAEREGCTDLTVVNLFALRSTKPELLLTHPDPSGPENYGIVINSLDYHDVVIAAWGAHKLPDTSLLEVLKKRSGIYCLGKTKDGSPRHPLYLKKDQPLEVFGAE